MELNTHTHTQPRSLSKERAVIIKPPSIVCVCAVCVRCLHEYVCALRGCLATLRRSAVSVYFGHIVRTDRSSQTPRLSRIARAVPSVPKSRNPPGIPFRSGRHISPSRIRSATSCSRFTWITNLQLQHLPPHSSSLPTLDVRPTQRRHAAHRLTDPRRSHRTEPHSLCAPAIRARCGPRSTVSMIVYCGYRYTWNREIVIASQKLVKRRSGNNAGGR